MSNYNTLFNGMGQLTEEGNKFMQEKFIPMVNELLASMETEAEIRVMTSTLSNLVGKSSSNLILSRGGKETPTRKTLPEMIKEQVEAAHLTDPFDNEHIKKIHEKLNETMQSLNSEATKLKNKLAENPLINKLNQDFSKWTKEQEEFIEELLKTAKKDDKLPEDNKSQ